MEEPVQPEELGPVLCGGTWSTPAPSLPRLPPQSEDFTLRGYLGAGFGDAAVL